jgi:N-acetylmuramoyl-L-alanine amidase
MGRATITRRRALALGAATGLGSLLSASPVPALGRRASRARGFGLTVGPGDFEGATSRVLRTSRRFELLGVRGADAVRGGLEVRARRRGGPWSPWAALAVRGDHAPDTGSGRRASDPVWFGGSHELQLRARRPLRGPLRVHLVAVPGAARRRLGARTAARAAQAAAPGGPPPIIPRAAWGAAAVPPRALPDVGQVQLAFVHHTVTANDYGPAESAAIVLAIAKYHRDTNGWNDIGYNFLVDQYGQTFEGRAGGVESAIVGAQAQGYNSQSTGVAVLGTFTAGGVAEPALGALARLLAWKLSLHGVPCLGQLTVITGGGPLNRYPAGTPVLLQRISGHRDGDATSCPGDALYAQLPTLRTRAAALAGPVQVTQGQVTLQAADTSVLYAEDAVFSGRVTRADSTAGAGERVELQKRLWGRPWVTIAATTALADGSWVARVPWRRPGAVRAVAAGLRSPAVPVAMVPRLSARTAASRVVAGGAIALHGRVRPKTPTVVVVELRGRGGRYRRVGSVRASVRGRRWAAAVRLRASGRYRLTPRTLGNGGVAVGSPFYVRAARPPRRRRR